VFVVVIVPKQKRKKKKDVGFSIVFAAYDTVVITAEASLMRRKRKIKSNFFITFKLIK